MNYNTMSRDQLIAHIEAYAQALHQLKDRCQTLMVKLEIMERSMGRERPVPR